MKRLSILLTLVMMTTGLFAQDQDVVSQTIDSFTRANDATKVDIVRNADDEFGDFSPLYLESIQLLASRVEELDVDANLRGLAEITMQRLVSNAVTEGAVAVMEIFENARETAIRIQAAQALSTLAVGNARVQEAMNRYLSATNGLVAGGTQIDRQTFAVAIETMGSIGNGDTYVGLLDTIRLQVSEAVTVAAQTALLQLDVDQVELASQAIRRSSAAEKQSIFRLLMSSDQLSGDERNQVALAALSDAVGGGNPSADAQRILREIRGEAARILTAAAYADATSALVRHFNATVVEFDRGIVTRGFLLEAIDALGAMDTDEAAVRLSAFMDLINSYTENDRPYDLQITLRTIQNLQVLGRQVAYNPLFYATLLTYPNQVKDAAREALRALTR